jgi:type I restriction enzyme S subunit
MISEKAFNDVFHHQIVKKGTLIMSFKLTIGRISKLGIDACHNEAIISIYPKPNINQDYLGYYLSQIDYSDQQDRQVKGNTLNQAKIDKIPVLIPPLSEQITISSVLNGIKQQIDIENSCLSASKELKRAVMRELFTQGLRGEAQIETEIGLVPESWELKSLSNLCTISSGGTPPKSETAFWEGTIPWVSGKDLKKNRLTDVFDHITEDAAERYSKVAKPGSVLVLVRGMGLAKSFALSLIEKPMAFNQDVKALTPGFELTGPFLMSALTFLGPRMLQKLSTAAHGTKTLNQDDICSFQIPLPPLPEQREIVEILDAIDRKIELHKQKKALLEELFKSLLHKLMTGEVRVADLNLSAIEKVEVGD